MWPDHAPRWPSSSRGEDDGDDGGGDDGGGGDVDGDGDGDGDDNENQVPTKILEKLKSLFALPIFTT